MMPTILLSEIKLTVRFFKTILFMTILLAAIIIITVWTGNSISENEMYLHDIAVTLTVTVYFWYALLSIPYYAFEGIKSKRLMYAYTEEKSDPLLLGLGYNAFFGGLKVGSLILTKTYFGMFVTEISLNHDHSGTIQLIDMVCRDVTDYNYFFMGAIIALIIPEFFGLFWSLVASYNQVVKTNDKERRKYVRHSFLKEILCTVSLHLVNSRSRIDPLRSRDVSQNGIGLLSSEKGSNPQPYKAVLKFDVEKFSDSRVKDIDDLSIWVCKNIYYENLSDNTFLWGFVLSKRTRTEFKRARKRLKWYISKQLVEG